MRRSSVERRHLGVQEPPAIRVTRSDGSYLWDDDGTRYLDFTMGWCVGNLGWNHPALLRTAADFRGPDYVYPNYAYEPWAVLAQLLASIAPGRLTKCFRATGGSEAVELALQAAMIHTGRRGFLSIEDSYHGNTLGTLSVAASDSRKKMPNLLPHCAHIEPPLAAETLERVERRLARRDVAAFIMEPISINLGVLVPDVEFMRGLQRLCRRHGTLLIMDEVATGFGRTGTLFACEQLGVEPDIMTVAKALSGGAGGIGAMIATAEVAESMEEEGSFYSTYGWHPRSTHVAIATVRYIIRHRESLLRHVVRMSAHFHERLDAMPFREEPEVNARGLAIAVDVDDEDYASLIEKRCRRAGLLVTTESSSVLLLPALNVDRVVADRGLDILERCV
ncbi:MAG: argD [Gemmatimonadetes bacterium]|nr:argD [Gemmatimonadota bacterium]